MGARNTVVGNSTLPESAVFTDGVYVLGGCRSSFGCGQVMAYVGQLGLALYVRHGRLPAVPAALMDFRTHAALWRY